MVWRRRADGYFESWARVAVSGHVGELGGHQLGPFVVGAAGQVRGERARDHPGEAAEGLGELLLLVLDPFRRVVGEHAAVLAPPDDRGEVLRGADIARVPDSALDLGLLQPGRGDELDRVQAGWSGFHQRDADQVAVVLRQRLGRAARAAATAYSPLRSWVSCSSRVNSPLSRAPSSQSAATRTRPICRRTVSRSSSVDS